MDKIRINLYDLLTCISDAQDLISSNISKHHQQVAYLAFRLSEHINLSIEQQHNIFLAALIHDIGALTNKEKLELIETESMDVNNHAFRGAKLLEEFKPLQISAGIIKFHHIPWNNGKGSTYKKEDVPIESHIIHLADRTCALIRPDCNIITQLPDILSTISEQVDSLFRSDLVDALLDISIEA